MTLAVADIAMRIFAISDLHLSLAPPHKEMEVFGEEWRDHSRIIADNWRERIGDNDIVLIPGDISWAMHLENALPDLQYVASLPGRKVIVRGNHDFWWTSISRVRSCLHGSILAIQNDSVLIDGVAIGGARLWDIPRLNFSSLSRRRPSSPKVEEMEARRTAEDNERILTRELSRLETSLRTFPAEATVKIAMVHFPPLGPDLSETAATRIIKAYGVTHCVFGHLHQIVPDQNHDLFGIHNGITYSLVSCDYLDFAPRLIIEV